MNKQYFIGTGKRKTSVARIFLKEGKGKIYINGIHAKKYFSRKTSLIILKKPLELFNISDKFDITISVSGGGITGQVDAIKHGITRALITYDYNLREKLRKNGFVTRDSRIVERKKVGFHKSRKKPQFSKR